MIPSKVVKKRKKLSINTMMTHHKSNQIKSYEAGLRLLENYTSGLCATLLERLIYMFSAILDDIDEPDRLVEKPYSESPWPPSLGSRCAPSRWSCTGAAIAFASSRRAKPGWLGLAPRCIRWDWQTRLGDGVVPLCRPYVKSST